MLTLLDLAGGWCARLASIVLILSSNYDVLLLEQLNSKLSTGFSDVQPAFLEVQGTEIHLIAGLKGLVSCYQFSSYFLLMLKIEFLWHSYLLFTVWNEVEMQYLNYFQNAVGDINERWKRCNCPSSIAMTWSNCGGEREFLLVRLLSAFCVLC